MKPLKQKNWVEETLQSLDGSQRAQAPEQLLEKALQRAAFGPARVLRLPAIQVWSAAACALVLVVANLFMCLDFSHKRTNSKEVFAKEYFGNNDAIPF